MWWFGIILIFFLIAAFLLGAFLPELVASVSFLKWLGFSMNFGIAADAPMILDLIICRLAFGFELNVNIAQIILGIIAIALFKFVSDRL